MERKEEECVKMALSVDLSNYLYTLITMIRIFTDGGSRGNPGPAGAGAVLFDEKGTLLKEGAKFLGTMTNNEAEYEAVLLGLSLAKTHFGKEKLKDLSIEVCLDSELVARQLSLRYQVKEPRLFSYFVTVSNLRITLFPNLTFRHVLREQNKEADRLANKAMDQGA